MYVNVIFQIKPSLLVFQTNKGSAKGTKLRKNTTKNKKGYMLAFVSTAFMNVEVPTTKMSHDDQHSDDEQRADPLQATLNPEPTGDVVHVESYQCNISSTDGVISSIKNIEPGIRSSLREEGRSNSAHQAAVVDDDDVITKEVGGDEELIVLEEDDDIMNGRERLKRHRKEVAGRVWIPEIWGQEELLKDWIGCSSFDDPSLLHAGIMSARAALVQQAAGTTPPNSQPSFTIQNRQCNDESGKNLCSYQK